jgi:hypothetical protein
MACPKFHQENPAHQTLGRDADAKLKGWIQLEGDERNRGCAQFYWLFLIVLRSAATRTVAAN